MSSEENKEKNLPKETTHNCGISLSGDVSSEARGIEVGTNIGLQVAFVVL